MSNKHETQPPQAWLDNNEHLLLADERINHAPELVTTKTDFVTVHNSDDGTEGAQDIGYCVVDPIVRAQRIGKTTTPVIVRFGQWSERADRPFDVSRSEAIAAKTKHMVIAVDTPGQSHNSPKLTRKQKEGMDTGNFNPVTEAQWSAVEQVLKGQNLALKDTELILVGSSQGATLVASALQTAPEDALISTALLWNSPSFSTLKERSAFDLAAKFFIKGITKNTEYLSFNPAWVADDPMKEFVSRVGARLLGHQKAFKGMVRAQDHLRLPEAFLNEQHRRMAGVLITLIHGTHDAVSPLQYNERAEYLFNKSGLVVRRQELLDEHHAFTNCIPAVARVVEQAISRR